MGAPKTPSSTASTVTTNSSSTPWSGAADYLTQGGTSGKGVYGDVLNYANNYSELTPQESSLMAGQQSNLDARNPILQSNYNTTNGLSQALMNGAYNTNFGGVANAGLTNSTAANAGLTNSTAANAGLTNSKNAPNSYALQSNIKQGMSALGNANPANALSNAMSGNVNTSVLGAMNQKNIDQATQGFNNDVRTVNQQIMPGINNDAFAAGQYGGSRQGIAQGLALQGLGTEAGNLAQNALDSGNQLYGNAYQQAQSTAAQTANSLAGLAANNSQFNAGQDTQNNQYNTSNALNNSQYNAGQANNMSQFNANQNNASSLANASNANNMAQFNANLGLQNNTQQMAQKAQNLTNASTGNQLANDASTNLFSGQDQTYAAQQGLANTPQQQQLDMLNLRLNALSPGAALGGGTSGSTSTPYYSNTMGQVGGLMSGAGGLLSSLK